MGSQDACRQMTLRSGILFPVAIEATTNFNSATKTKTLQACKQALHKPLRHHHQIMYAVWLNSDQRARKSCSIGCSAKQTIKVKRVKSSQASPASEPG